MIQIKSNNQLLEAMQPNILADLFLVNREFLSLNLKNLSGDQIEQLQQKTNQQQLNQELLQICQTHKIQQIEIISLPQSDIASCILDKLIHKIGLVELQYSLSSPQPLTEPKNYLIKTAYPPFSYLLASLEDQADYHHNIAPDYYLGKETINWLLAEQEYYDICRDPNAFLLTIWDQLKLVGLISGEIIGEQAKIYEVIVTKEYRQQKLGTYLLTSCFNYLQQKNVKEIILETWWSIPALPWYLKMGFEITGKNIYFSLN